MGNTHTPRTIFVLFLSHNFICRHKKRTTKAEKDVGLNFACGLPVRGQTIRFTNQTDHSNLWRHFLPTKRTATRVAPTSISVFAAGTSRHQYHLWRDTMHDDCGSSTSHQTQITRCNHDRLIIHPVEPPHHPESNPRHPQGHPTRSRGGSRGAAAPITRRLRAESARFPRDWHYSTLWQTAGSSLGPDLSSRSVCVCGGGRVRQGHCCHTSTQVARVHRHTECT